MKNRLMILALAVTVLATVPPISARPPLVPGRPYPVPWNKTKKKGLVHQNKSFFIPEGAAAQAGALA